MDGLLRLPRMRKNRPEHIIQRPTIKLGLRSSIENRPGAGPHGDVFKRVIVQQFG
jgi:hypothetical protein